MLPLVSQVKAEKQIWGYKTISFFSPFPSKITLVHKTYKVSVCYCCCLWGFIILPCGKVGPECDNPCRMTKRKKAKERSAEELGHYVSHGVSVSSLLVRTLCVKSSGVLLKWVFVSWGCSYRLSLYRLESFYIETLQLPHPLSMPIV